MDNKCSTVKKDECANPTEQAEDNSCTVLSEDLFASDSTFDLSDDILANILMLENRLISNMNNLCANSYFWKGLISGGANYRKEIYVSKLAGLIIGGKFVLKVLNVRLVI